MRALAHAAVAELAVPRGDFAAGQAHMRAAVALRRRLNRPRELALALLSASYLERLAGDAAAAAATWAEGEALAAELADDEVTARLAQGKGRDARNTAAADTARRPLEVALAYARRAGDPLLLAHRLLDLVPVTLSTGDGERARAQAEEALTLARRIGHRPATAMALNELGEIARGRGDDEQAARHYIAALRLWREMGNRSDVPRLLHSLAYAALHAGDSARARTLFRRGIDQFREAMVERGVAEGLAGLACVAAVGAQPLAAARLWGAAEALREANGWGMWAADRAEYARYVARAHAAAETPAFAAAWQAGRALTADQALAEAPEDAGAPPDAGAPAAPLPAGAPAGDL